MNISKFIDTIVKKVILSFVFYFDFLQLVQNLKCNQQEIYKGFQV